MDNKILIGLGAAALFFFSQKGTEDGPQVDPCKDVSCGEFGWCQDGKCTCRKGYSGMSCEYAPGDPGSTDNPIITTQYT